MTTKRAIAIGTLVGGCAVVVGFQVVGPAHATSTGTPTKEEVVNATHPWDFPGNPASVAKVPAPRPSPAVPVAVPNDRQIVTPQQRGGVPLPMPANDFLVDNLYQETTSTAYITVIAGAKAADVNQPVVRILTNSPGTGATTSVDIPLPGGTGKAHLVAIAGETVDVVDGQGSARRTLDVASAAFK